MSWSEAVRFFDDISSGKLVIDAAQIRGKGIHTDMHDYAKSFGYDFSKDEMLEVVNEKGLVGDGEISEEQMEALAGGVNSGVISVVVVGIASAAAAAF